MFNSPAASVPNPALSTFGQLVLNGYTVSGGLSYVTLTTADGMYSTHAYDTVLNLSSHWTAAEFNVFGAGNASEANFNEPVSMEVHLAASVSPPDSLSCVNQSVTGESANLFIQTGCTVIASGNEINFVEANGYDTNGPLITGVSPSSVKATGGDVVTITGLRLSNPTAVTFNLLPVAIDTSNPSPFAIQFTAPACSPLGCAPGPGAGVAVTGPVGPAGSNMTATSYGGPIAQTPTVLSVSPASGPELTKIVVTGAGFLYDGPNAQFYIGNSPATNVACAVNSPNTQCSMTVPAQSGPATVPIKFGSPDSPAMYSEANWTYAGSAMPSVSSISPNHGPQAGGTQVTITGTNLTQTLEAGFNTTFIGITGDCPLATQCVFQTPRGTGQATVSVLDYNTGLQSGAPGPLFTYDVPPASGTLRPAGGPTAGGTAIEADLTSVSASTATAVQFDFSTGAVPISGAVCKTSVLNAANAYCDFSSPPLPADIRPPVAVPVSVTVAGQPLPLGNFTYTGVSPGSIAPAAGPPIGGTNLTVHVNNLLVGTGAGVDFNFDGTPTPALNAVCTVDAGGTGNSTCTATTPPLPAADTPPIDIPVSVTSQGQSVVVGDFQYGTKVTPPSQCVICREGGGTCSTANGKFVCLCQKSSPTGVCQ